MFKGHLCICVQHHNKCLNELFTAPMALIVTLIFTTTPVCLTSIGTEELILLLFTNKTDVVIRRFPIYVKHFKPYNMAFTF